MSVFADINNLIDYAVSVGLISPSDTAYMRNIIIEELGEKTFSDEKASGKNLPDTLEALCDYAADKGIIERTRTAYDIFDTKLMGALTPRPSAVISEFLEKYLDSPNEATRWYYKFSQDTNYIRRDRIARDMKWQTETEYGTLDITINLSKPEKDPRAIARAKNMPKSGYPLCALCVESVGYAGRDDFPARGNHRVIPIEICGEPWSLQYSPYVYYNEHCIALNSSHVPMKIDSQVFKKLLSFVDIFPHYFIGSNADLPIVGGSILAHEHFQGGSHEFAMERAETEREYHIKGFEDVSVGRLKWPMSVIRLRGEDKEKMCLLAARILEKWRGYTDESAYIYAETDGVPHNTITPIARMRNNEYELDLVLRNNITTPEHPLGLYHPHEELHHIKKENIGLIEVMGLAVLPSRLREELELMCDYAKKGIDFAENEKIEKHAQWARSIIDRKSADESYEDFFKREIGLVFEKVLKCAGVFPRDEKGLAAFDRFVGEV